MATYPSQSAMQGNTDTTPASPGWGGDYVSQGRVAMTGGTSKVQLAGTAQAIKGNTQIDKDEAFREEVEELVEELVDYSTLAGRINQEFSTYKTARQPLERNIWVKAFLNNKGVYGSNLNLEGGTSNAFVQVTSPKVRTALAMAMQILFPPGDQAWTLDAPANPAMVEEAFQLLQQGLQVPQIQEILKERAKQSAEKLEGKVLNGLDQAEWSLKGLQLVMDTIVFGMGCIEGPLAVETHTVQDDELEVAQGQGAGIWDRIKLAAKAIIGTEITDEEKLSALTKAGVIDNVRPELTVWSPFDVYWDPGARSVEGCKSIILRMVVSREQLRELRGQKGFDTDALNEALAEHMDGNWKPETWEPIVAAGNTYFQQNMPNGRFVILKRWGMLSGRDLKDAGMSISADRLEEQVMAQVWVVGNRIIRLSISDELHRNRIPVYLPRFMVSPLTLAGVGLPEMMFDSQDAVNACERAKMDNMAQICRPNVTIRTAFLDLRDPTEAIEFKAGKIWLVKETELPNPPENPVQFWVPANALPQISQVQNESLMLAEEQTGLPRFLQGQNSEGTHNRTFGGASLQFDRAVTPFKTFIFNFEHDCTAPLIASFGRFYQLFSNDPQIKGDFKVLTKGVQGLMAREVLMQRLTDGLQAIGNNSMLASSMAIKVDPAKVWDMVLQGTGLSHQDIFNTPQGQQILEQKQAQAQAQQQQFAMQQQTAPKQRAETPPKDAWIEFMKEAPDGSQSKYAFMLEAAKQWGFMTPDVNEALRHDMQVSGLQDIDNAHQAGVNQAEREMGPHEQHALDLQQQQVKGAIQSQLAQQQAAAPGGPNAG